MASRRYPAVVEVGVVILPMPTRAWTSRWTVSATLIATSPWPRRITPLTGCSTWSNSSWTSPAPWSMFVGGGDGTRSLLLHDVVVLLHDWWTPRPSVAAPKTLPAANRTPGTTSHRARPYRTPTSKPTAQSSAATARMIFTPVGDPPVMARPTAATTSATPKHTRPRGDRVRRARLRGSPVAGIGAVATAADGGSRVVVAGGGSGVVPGSAVSRGFHRASATPTRSTKSI